MRVRRNLHFGVLLIVILLAACGTADPTLTATPSPVLADTATPSETPTAEIVATETPAISAGAIKVAQASCRAGPGGAYMLRVTLYEGDAVEVLGHMAHNENWLLLRTPSFTCWVSAGLVALEADPSTLPIIENPHAVLPLSNYYGPLDSVSATRQGDLVTVRWAPFEPRPDDRSEHVPYIVEAWVCQNGEFVFRTYGAQERKAQIVDERGACADRSHARVIAAEKHGYTPTREVPWP